MKISDPDKGIIPFEDWPHLLRLLEIFSEHRDVIILKARQLGVSWLVAAYGLWTTLFFESARVLMLSQGEDEATELLDKSRFIHSQLPPFLKLDKGKDQAGLITFPASHSQIRALPSTEKAGHGYSATLVIRDELEHHPYPDENFGAVGPSIDQGGQLIDLSTVNKMKLFTHFKTRYVGAKAGSNTAFPVFLSVMERASRLDGQSFEEWFEIIQKKYPPWQVEQEYPFTEDEALTSLKTRKFFSIDETYMDVANPITHELSDKYSGLVKIYKLPVVGKKYLVFTDPSDGKEDPHAIIVTDQFGEQVAESHGKTPADTCAQIHDDLVRLYNNAFNSYELNSRAGGIFSQKLKDLETPNQCPFLEVNGKLNIKGKTGWWTSKTLWNTFIWGLEEAVRLRQITIRNKQCLDEFNQFIVPEGEDPQKTRGGTDDYIDAWSRVWHLRKYLPLGAGKMKSYHYRVV